MKKLLILIVDDESANRALLCTFVRLIHPDSDIFSAEHGAQAWEIINSNMGELHIVISDVEMPQMNGVELTGRIRQEHPHINIILMSGRGEPKDHEAHVFLAKPFKMADLAEVIRKFLREK